MLIVIDYGYMSGQRENNVPNQWHSNGSRNGISLRSSEREEDASIFEQRERHRDFVAALERITRHGCTGLEESNWVRALAFDLNWDEEEVEIYAYRYFVSLSRQGIRRETNELINRQINGGGSNPGTQHVAPVQAGDLAVGDGSASDIRASVCEEPWTIEEIARFQSLLSEVIPPSNATEVEYWVWAERISERLLSRSPAEVLDRWRNSVPPRVG